MKKYLFIAFAAFTLAACEKNPEDETTTVKDYSVSGLVEKGPFVSGSTINLQPLSEEFAPVGTNFHTEITDNEGSFNLGKVSLTAPYATLTANGYFFNEVAGELSNGTLSLNAIVDLSNKTTVNVNLLTHLKYYRVQHLLGEGRAFKDADKQAQDELFMAFGLQAFNTGDVSQYSITAGTDQAAALIAISSLLLVNRSEAQLTEYLATLSKEFGDNGVFSSSTKAKIAADRDALASKLEKIPANIIRRYQELGKTVGVKDLYPYFDWDGDGVADNMARPSFVVNSEKRTADGRIFTITTNRDWSITDKPEWVTVDPVSGNASTQPQTITVKGMSTTASTIGQSYPIKVSYGTEMIDLQYKYYPVRNHSDKRLLLLYSAGFNNLSSYLKDDIESLCSGYVPTSDAGDDVLLIFSRLPEGANQYATLAKPLLTKIYENENGEFVRETLKEWNENTPASSKETMQSVFAYITEHFPGYKYGMVFSSYGTGWLPAGYFGNSLSFGDDYSSNSGTWNVSARSIGQDHNADGTNVEMDLKDFAEGITTHLDYLIFDSPYMGAVEVVYELRNKCDYFAASVTEVLADGLDYSQMGYRLLCSEQADVQGVCNDYYIQYANQSGASQSATISLIDCSKLDHLAAVCAPVFDKRRSAFAEAEEGDVQSFNRYSNNPFFYDMADIFRSICGAGDADYNTVATAISDCVVYKANTPNFMGKPINTFCGLSMFLPSMGKNFLREFYCNNISWCIDTQYFQFTPNVETQYLYIYQESQTKAVTESVFEVGTEVSVNDIPYTMEALDILGGLPGVAVPQAESYRVSCPAGKVMAGDHISRVKVALEENVGSTPAMYYYGAIARYEDFPMNNPASVRMYPVLQAIRFKIADENKNNWSYIEVAPVADNEYLAGTATYVFLESEKYVNPGINPDIVFDNGIHVIRINNDSTDTSTSYSSTEEYPCFVTFPQTLSQGLKVTMYGKSGEVLFSKAMSNSLELKAGYMSVISLQ